MDKNAKDTPADKNKPAEENYTAGKNNPADRSEAFHKALHAVEIMDQGTENLWQGNMPTLEMWNAPCPRRHLSRAPFRPAATAARTPDATTGTGKKPGSRLARPRATVIRLDEMPEHSVIWKGSKFKKD